MDYLGGQAKVKNAYNDSLGYLKRIDILWYRISSSRIKLDIYNWLNYLIAQYTELSTQISKEERIQYRANIINLKEGLATAYIIKGNNIQIRQSLYNGLMELEQDLRDIWHKAGLDIKTIEENPYGGEHF
jgi:hypothetical protein